MRRAPNQINMQKSDLYFIVNIIIRKQRVVNSAHMLKTSIFTFFLIILSFFMFFIQFEQSRKYVVCDLHFKANHTKFTFSEAFAAIGEFFPFCLNMNVLNGVFILTSVLAPASQKAALFRQKHFDIKLQSATLKFFCHDPRKQQLPCVHKTRKYSVVPLRNIANFSAIRILYNDRFFVIRIIRFYKKVAHHIRYATFKRQKSNYDAMIFFKKRTAAPKKPSSFMLSSVSI